MGLLKTNEGGTTAFPSFCDGRAFLYAFFGVAEQSKGENEYDS